MPFASPKTRRKIAASQRYAGHPIAPLPVVDRALFNDEASLLTLAEQNARVTYLKHGIRMPQAG